MIIQTYPKVIQVFSALGIIAVVGVADYHAGHDLSLLLFYLIPILQVTWLVGIRAGVAISLVCAAAWFSVDWILAREAASFVTLWNTTIRLCVFLLVAYIISIQAALKEALEKEKRSARTDFLTGALNSRAFAEQTEQEIARGKRYGNGFSIAYIDLDNFKTINDTLGHTVGDRLLKSVADILRRSVRATDFIARLGGDEFAVLLPETPGPGAAAVMQKCRRQLFSEMERNRWPVTASIGLATYSDPPVSYDDMLRQVDALMYSAKVGGKDRIAHRTFETKA